MTLTRAIDRQEPPELTHADRLLDRIRAEMPEDARRIEYWGTLQRIAVEVIREALAEAGKCDACQQTRTGEWGGEHRYCLPCAVGDA